ncbi:MAG: aerobic carbon-monoxide dehydrogenase small subunit [Solirubrobacteraceae bacterium]|jgi:carbon-monoxide dehydrogenase small subunit|nr:aerobic carbon-monoxide dehydrogenase small subunit [Solirubrobacteraceae bacterium]
MSTELAPSDAPRAITLHVNGRAMTALAEPRMLLSDFLRHELELTGTHVGCEHGVCGACTVRMDGDVVLSCIVLAIQAEGAELETIEGAGPRGELDAVQQAFREHHGLQCGFCTPGMVLAARTLLEHNPAPSEREVREYLAGNVCRCTGYVGIVEAVLAAALKLRSTGEETA